MPRTPTFPAPSATVCPICDAPLPDPTCRSCGARFATEDGLALWRLDHDLHGLCRARDDLVGRILASAPVVEAAATMSTAVPVADPTADLAPARASTAERAPGAVGRQAGAVPTGLVPGSPDWEGPGPMNAAAHRNRTPVGAPGRDGSDAARSGPSVAGLLVGLGALSLVVAVVVFTAVTWSELAAWAQGAIIVGLSAVATVATVAARRRAMGATAEALGAVTVALGLADVQVARTALAEVVDRRTTWAVGLAVLAAGLVVGGSRWRVRTPVLAGTAIALVPVPLLAVGSGLTAVMGGLAVQAAVVTVVLARPEPASTAGRERPDDGGIEGPVGASPRVRTSGGAAVILAAGGAVSCAAALLTGAVLTGWGLEADPVAHPVAPALVVALLAVVGVALPRRFGRGAHPCGDVSAATVRGGRSGREDLLELLSVAGIGLAAVPAPLLTLGLGRPVVSFAVLAAQSVLLAALTGRRSPVALGFPERVVAALVAAAGASVAVPGAVALTLVAVVDDPWAGRLAPLAVLVGLSLTSVVAGVVVRRPGLAAAGAGLAFLPVPLALLGSAPGWVVAGALLGQTVVAVGVHPRARFLVVARAVALGGAASWLVAVVTAVGAGVLGGVRGEVPGPTWVTFLLAAAAAVAVGAPIAARWTDRDVSSSAFAAGTLALLGSVATPDLHSSVDGWVTSVLASAAVVALAAAVGGRGDGDRPWSAVTAVGLVVGGALALVPAVDALGVVVALVERAGSTPGSDIGLALSTWLEPSFEAHGGVPGWSTSLRLVCVAGLAGALAVVCRRAGAMASGAVLAALVVVVPVVGGVDVGATVAGLGVLVVAVAAVVHRHPGRVGPVLVLVGLVVLGGLVGAASVPTVVGWAALTVVVLVTTAAVVLVDDRPGAVAWVVAAAGSCVVATVTVAWAVDAPSGSGVVALAMVAALGAPAALLVERTASRAARGSGDAVIGVAGSGLLFALAGSPSANASSVVVALTGVAGAVVAVGPRWRVGWLVAAASAVLVAWIRLGEAGVAVVEAYTVPLAVAALAVGLVERRGRGSWERFGAGLVAGVAPTTLMVTVDAELLRSVIVVAGAACLVLWGASARLRAPLMVGSVALGAVSLRHLVPVAAEVPRYVGFGVAGLVLLAVGATFEQRRAELRSARDAYTRLG